jgi:transposase
MAGQEELFAIALGVKEPIYIETVEFDKDKGELHIRMNFRRGARFACSSYGEADLPVHDTGEKTWRHLNFFQYKCFIHLRTPRTKCPKCGERLYMPPWGRKNSGFTMLFELLMLTLAKAMPVSQIAALIGEHDTKVWRVIRSYVGKAYAYKNFEEKQTAKLQRLMVNILIRFGCRV